MLCSVALKLISYLRNLYVESCHVFQSCVTCLECEPGSKGRMEGEVGRGKTDDRELVQGRSYHEGISKREAQLHYTHGRGETYTSLQPTQWRHSDVFLELCRWSSRFWRVWRVMREVTSVWLPTNMEKTHYKLPSTSSVSQPSSFIKICSIFS